MKKCFKCLETKSLDEFPKHSKMFDGHLNKCKICIKKYNKERQEGPKREEILKQYREYAKRPDRKAKIRESGKQWRKDNPEKRSAHIILGNALRDGKITRQPCFVCGDRAEAHHPDYSSPLDVVWLCVFHHKQTHSIARDEQTI